MFRDERQILYARRPFERSQVFSMNRPFHVLHLDEADCVMLGDEEIPFVEAFLSSFVDFLEQRETLILDLVGRSLDV